MNRNAFEPGPLAEADYLANEDGWTLVFVRELAHPTEQVWAALTDPAQLREWAPFTADRSLDTEGEATLTMIDDETEEDFPAVVRRAERPQVLEYSWGDDLLRWELSPTGSGTRLTLRHTVGDQDLLPKVAAGWHICLDVAERLLDGRPVGPIVGAAAKDFGWDELHDAYRARLGTAGAG
jgi:uncharacterized protein YndB with AHSA1/START domain